MRINGRIAKRYVCAEDDVPAADVDVGVGRTSVTTVSCGSDIDVEDEGDSESGTSVLHESSFSRLLRKQPQIHLRVSDFVE